MKKSISVLLCVILMFFICETYVNAEENVNLHCTCGEETCASNGHCTDHSWNKWEQTNVLPSNAGYYYLSNDVELGGSTWTVSNDIHLCLNGHEIKASSYNGSYMIVVNNKLTISDCKNTCGKITSIHANGIINVNGGELNIYNGSITHCKQNGHIIQATSGAKVNIYGGTFTNERCATTNLTGLYGFMVAKGYSGDSGNKTVSQINIFGGKFVVKEVTNNDSSAFSPYLINTDGDGVINICGGDFTASYFGYSKHSFGTCVITGGKFNTNTTNLTMHNGDAVDLTKSVDEDYELKKLEDQDIYQVYKIENYQVGDNKYSTLAKAINAATNNDDVIKVLKDVDVIDTAIQKTINIDLDGHVLKGVGTTSQLFLVDNGGKLTIKDSSEQQTGKIYSYNATPTLIRINDGELIVEGGTFSNQVDNYVSYSHIIDCKNGEVTLKGGTFSILEGYSGADNFFSSVVAATKINGAQKSIINIKGGTYNCSYSTNGKFKSRIFTPYKNDNNDDFGTINITSGSFNGDYNNPQLTSESGLTMAQIRNYLCVKGGSFDRDTFTDQVKVNDSLTRDLKLADIIDTNSYYVYTSANPTRYNVLIIPEDDDEGGQISEPLKYRIVKTGIQ